VTTPTRAINGADLNIIEMESRVSPLDLAKKRGNQKAVELLEQFTEDF